MENGKAIEPINVIKIESFRKTNNIDTLTQPSQFLKIKITISKTTINSIDIKKMIRKC